MNNLDDVKEYIDQNYWALENNVILIDEFLKDATEVDVDILRDNEGSVIIGIMEHIEAKQEFILVIVPAQFRLLLL